MFARGGIRDDRDQEDKSSASRVEIFRAVERAATSRWLDGVGLGRKGCAEIDYLG